MGLQRGPVHDHVRVTIRTLRRKLGEPPLIHNVPKAGYRIDPRQASADDAAHRDHAPRT